MNLNEQMTLCDSLAIIILARLLKRNGAPVTLDDLQEVERNIASGVTTYVESSPLNTLTIRGLTTKQASVHTQTMLPYINTNEKLRVIADRLSIGNQIVDIRVDETKVVCSYSTENNTVKEISFSVIPNKNNNNVYGVGYQTKDFGFSIHKDYMNKIFGIHLDKDVNHTYVDTCSNDGKGETVTSVMNASKQLFAHCAGMINEKLIDADENDYFIFFNRLLNGLHGSDYPIEDEFEVIKQITGEIISLNYETMFSVLKLIKVNVTMGDNKLPLLKVEDTVSKNLIFTIRIRRESSDHVPHGKKYRIYLEPGGLLNLLMNNQLESV